MIFLGVQLSRPPNLRACLDPCLCPPPITPGVCLLSSPPPSSSPAAAMALPGSCLDYCINSPIDELPSVPDPPKSTFQNVFQ